jgi:hypothetical protein
MMYSCWIADPRRALEGSESQTYLGVAMEEEQALEGSGSHTYLGVSMEEERIQ